jgi:hypothetical protein
MRNSSMWPLKGSAMPLTCRPMPKAAALRSMGRASITCSGEGTRQAGIPPGEQGREDHGDDRGQSCAVFGQGNIILWVGARQDPL